MIEAKVLVDKKEIGSIKIPTAFYNRFQKLKTDRGIDNHLQKLHAQIDAELGIKTSDFTYSQFSFPVKQFAFANRYKDIPYNFVTGK